MHLSGWWNSEADLIALQVLGFYCTRYAGTTGSASAYTRCVKLMYACRGDIDYALHQGCSPRFYRHEMPSEVSSAISQRAECVPNELLRYMPICDPQLQSIHGDMMGFCNLLNDDTKLLKMQPYSFEETLISVSYRLLYLYPLNGEGSKDSNDNAYHLGVLALLMTLLYQYGRLHRGPYDLLADKLRSAATTIFNEGSNADVTLLLWLLFIGGISVFGPVDVPWLHHEIRACLSALQADSWQQVRAAISCLPWINLVHDSAGKDLWKAATSQ